MMPAGRNGSTVAAISCASHGMRLFIYYNSIRQTIHGKFHVDSTFASFCIPDMCLMYTQTVTLISGAGDKWMIQRRIHKPPEIAMTSQ